MMPTRSIAAASTLVLMGIVQLFSQDSGTTVRKHRTEVRSEGLAPDVLAAEAALQKQDYFTAEPLLLKATSHDAGDYRAWFDLGFLYRATNRPNDAIAAYQKSIAIKPDLFESNLYLGKLLAADGQSAEAVKYLRAATQLKPESDANENLFRAWLELGRILGSTKEGHPDALAAFKRAAGMNSKDIAPHLSAGNLLQEEGRFEEAESEFTAALALDPKSTDAIAALANVYTRENKLEIAESTLRDYLKLEPANPAAHLQLGRLLLHAGKSDDALHEFESGSKNDPQDFDLQREIASVYALSKHYKEAADRYAPLVQTRPNDADLRLQFGITLLHLKTFRAAEQQFLEAIKLNPKLPDAYGNLAVAASENKDYALAIRALDARAKLVPEAPSTFFLRATAYDNLKAFPQAADNYRQFLAAANGKFPDQEWQARHRLIAIDKNAPQKK